MGQLSVEGVGHGGQGLQADRDRRISAPWLDSPLKWEACAAYARKAGILGIDSETYGHDVADTSPAYRAKIHVWSIAFYTGGHSGLSRLAKGAVLPPEALPIFAEVLASPKIVKVAHNARHDRHALENHGYATDGFLDTLDLVRLAYPERGLRVDQGYALKPIARDLLAKPARDEYKDITMGMGKVLTEVKVCACGKEKCRGRKLPTHEKRQESREVEAKVTWPLETIIPGHQQWLRLLDYAAADAVDALELYDLATRRLASLRRPRLPW